MLTIRRATANDEKAILRIFNQAKKFMKEQGNYAQWAGDYPNAVEIAQDLQNQALYVVCTTDLEAEAKVEAKSENKVNLLSEVVGTFALYLGEDPTYRVIYDGKWRQDVNHYGTIHRLASDGRCRGVAQTCFQFCQKQASYLRVDTHEDNKKMQEGILHFGFVYCGKIICGDGTERLAYDYIVPAEKAL